MAKWNLWTIIKNIFKGAKKDFAHLAVVILEDIKPALNSGVVGFLSKLFDSLTKSNIAEDVIKFLQTNIPKILAANLAIQGLPDNPTSDEILKFEQDIIEAFGKLDKKSKLYTIFVADTYGILQETFETTPDVPPTYAEWVETIQKIFLKLQADKEASEEENQ